MKSKEVAVLEIGTSEIRLVIGRQGVNDTYNIINKSCVPYSGYSDGEFVDIYETKEAIITCKKKCEETCGIDIKKMYVGIPAQFSALSLKRVYQNSPKKIRVTKEIVDNVLGKGVDDRYKDNYTLIDSSASYFCLDDNRRVLNALKQKTSMLSALVSCIYCENTIIEFLNETLSESGVEFAEYLSEPLCTAKYLKYSPNKDEFTLVIDCGYSSTSVALLQGNALLMLQSFSYGGAHIEADLADYLKIPFKSAGELKNKIALSISPENDDYYELKLGEKYVKIPMNISNAIVCSKIDLIGSAINECLKMCKEEYPDFISVGLTGGGLSYIKGARDYLAKVIGKNVELLIPGDPAHNKPNLSATIGLLSCALKIDKNRN